MSTTDNSLKHPKGLYVLFATEMWERFNYYGMRAVLVLFMTKALLFDKAFASSLYGSYTGLIYLTPLIGGFVADKFWGNRKSIVTGGLLASCFFFDSYLWINYFTLSLSSGLPLTNNKNKIYQLCTLDSSKFNG